MAREQTAIEGLEWRENWRIDNGKDSFVVPFATLRPINIVFHGEKSFNYGHYGIHLGQEDRLTFLGPTSQIITAHFIDCRRNSKTPRRRLTLQFHPSSGRVLCIPPGVAHAFDSLENVFTINNYKLFLPDPQQWLTGSTEWNSENDVVNIPMDIAGERLPLFTQNEHEASDVFYGLVSKRQKESIPKLKHQYPFTEDIALDDGSSVRLLFRKKTLKSKRIPVWQSIRQIEGAGWARHRILWSGDSSGFIPLLDPVPFYIVDHGEKYYTHDAYGIHLGQEDRLTFLGPSNHKIRLTLVDCREKSRTLHGKVVLEFYPNPLRFLVIPNGVAHRFERLENVFTVNRPFVYVRKGKEKEYAPGNDVIDWPIDRSDFPKLKANKISATRSFYAAQMRSQQRLLSSPPMHATPIVLLSQDRAGRPVRVSLRKPAQVSS